MRKLESKEHRAKKDKKKKYILGALLIFITFGSVFGVIVSFMGQGQKAPKAITYHGTVFSPNGTLYTFKWNGGLFGISQAPTNLENLTYSINISKNIYSFSGSPVYIESRDFSPYQELANNLQNTALRVQQACTNASTCFDSTFPIKDCSNNVIVVKTAPQNKIYQNNSCIYIEGNQADLLSLTDVTILKLLGIN